jgi:hypothetical protein
VGPWKERISLERRCSTPGEERSMWWRKTGSFLRTPCVTLQQLEQALRVIEGSSRGGNPYDT